MKKRAKALVRVLVLLSLITVGLVFAYKYNYIPHMKYSNDDFGIEQYRSEFDMDSDGIDDQTDLLNGAKKYLATKPKYKSKYYSTDYPDDNYGVCTDVVANGLLRRQQNNL